MVQEIDGGRSTRRFNCAGWTFRELNCHGKSCSNFTYGGHGWWPDVGDIHKNFVKAGLLRPLGVTDSYQVGDKCFFFGKNDKEHKTALHVAEVVSSGYWSATVRAPDNATGVFDAEIGWGWDGLLDWDVTARWFTDSYGDVVCYRWTGAPPETVPDREAMKNDPNACNDDDNNGGGDDGDDDGDDDDDDETCPDYEYVTGSCGASLDGCIEGFYCSRETIACEQEACPENAGRTYTLECCCDCWDDKTYKGVYDPCRPGYLLECVPR